MRHLFDIQQVMLEQFDVQSFYHRHLFHSITLDNAITGILGSRGVGKTTFLLYTTWKANQAKRNSALYISADNPFFLTCSLLEVADYLYKETDIVWLCIDEIHKYPNWEQELKNIADIYKRIKVIFTGSSIIDIVRSRFDLSRRVTLHHFGGLSFREYLEFYLGKRIEPVSLSNVVSNHTSLCASIDVPQIMKHFRRYLQTGYYLFFNNLSSDYDKFQAITSIVQKIIYEDIALLHQLKTSTLYSIEQVYKFILNSPAGELNVNKLANLVSKSHDQIMDYLHWLNQAGLIHTLHSNKGGKGFVKSPKKLFPDNSNLMYAAYLPLAQDQFIGKLRETFFINQLKNAKYQVFYPDVGDVFSEGYFFEIGGKNKQMQQLQGKQNGYVVADGILTGDKSIVPLYLFGLLY